MRLTGDRLPEIKHVVHTNFCDIGWKVDEATGRLIIVAVLDNLVKGAAGQAIQHFNVACGLDEREALLVSPRCPCLKFGGELVETPAQLAIAWAARIAQLARRGPLVVVHGGGREIDAELGAARRRRSRRSTACASPMPRTLEAVVAVLAGTINTRLVAALVGAGVRAVGLTGVDAVCVPVVEARPHVGRDGSAGGPRPGRRARASSVRRRWSRICSQAVTCR